MARRARRLDLKAQDGVAVLTVPRKAEVEIQAKPGEKVAVSLYRLDDPTFRTPVFRREVQGGQSLKVPAGEHLASLAAAGLAPDLKLLSAAPASRQRLAFVARPGWSLVLRALAKESGKAVPGAAARLQGLQGM